MDKKEIIAKIDKLRDELIRLQGEDGALIKAVCSLNNQRESVKHRRKAIHKEIEELKMTILKSRIGTCQE